MWRNPPQNGIGRNSWSFDNILTRGPNFARHIGTTIELDFMWIQRDRKLGMVWEFENGWLVKSWVENPPNKGVTSGNWSV